MVNVLATCGDSFGCGIGLPQEVCYEKSFAGLVASEFKLAQKVYARAGCCNFTIYLQVLEVVARFKHDPSFNPFVLVTATNHSRVFVPLHNESTYQNPKVSNVDYQNYQPYNHNLKPRQIEFFTEEIKYISETVSNIIEYQAGRVPHLNGLFRHVNKEKLEALKFYFTELYDDGVKHEYDKALFSSMHLLLKKNNIPHVIMDNSNTILDGIPEFLKLNWGYYTINYPDGFNSGHCNEEGNRLVSEQVIKHINENKLL